MFCSKNNVFEHICTFCSEKNTPIQYAVEVIDLAYRNNYKIVLATQIN